MKIKTISATLLAMIALLNSVTASSERWRDPKVYSINKLDPHTEFISYSSKEEALQPVSLENPWSSDRYQSINGTWDFNWYGSLDELPADWYMPSSSISKWGEMSVPGTWQSRGFDQLYYLNNTMPFEFTKLTKERREEFLPENIEQAKESGYIPDDAQSVGCYRKLVHIDKSRLEGRVTLRIGSAEAALVVYVNGREVGYSQDSFLPAEFDITEYLEAGENLIALKLYRWCDGSYMEVQDMIRWAGIYRDVYLKFSPKQSIFDLKFVGTPDKTLKRIEANYELTLENSASRKWSKGEVLFELYSHSQGELHTSWSRSIAQVKEGDKLLIDGTLELLDVELWSPDKPSLYTLIATLLDKSGDVIDVVRCDVGFRRFEQINGNFFLNGNRFFIKGVNRHEHHPVSGHYVPIESMIRDAELMKRNNINTVRTSHYPNDERWYYICNRYGIAVIDEANVECHNFEDVPDNRPQWIPSAVDRVKRMVCRDINNPSVFIWSLGNEQGRGWSEAFDQQYDIAKSIDNSRMVMCDRGAKIGARFESTTTNTLRSDKPDMITPMYRSRTSAAEYLVNRENDKRPFFMCEYAHAMGNAVGSLYEQWEMFYENEENGLNGGCIWDWVDQGVEAVAEDGTKYFQYGGDWGDNISFGNFCLNGLLLSDRSETPKLAEVKKCYEPFTTKAISIEKGEFELRNRLSAQSLSNYTTLWVLLADGEPIDGGTLNIDAPAGSKVNFTVPYNFNNLCDGKEYIVRIDITYSEDTLWAKRGEMVTFSEYKLKDNSNYELSTTAVAAASVDDNATTIVVSTTGGISFTFDKASGMLSSLRVKGVELLAKSSRDRLFDNTFAWVDNLFSLNRSMIRIPKHKSLDLENILRQGDAKIEIIQDNGIVSICIENLYLSAKGGGYGEVQRWNIDGLGRAEIIEQVEPAGSLESTDWIPRIGLRVPFDPSITDMTYYGLGPQESFVDRCYGAWSGIFSSKVSESYVAYPRPQDCGNREQVRWMSLSNDLGSGVKIVSPEPITMSVLPYRQDELKSVLHTYALPSQSTATEFRIAKLTTGIGNGSCGPITDLEYQPSTGELVEYKFYIIPFSKE